MHQVYMGVAMLIVMEIVPRQPENSSLKMLWLPLHDSLNLPTIL